MNTWLAKKLSILAITILVCGCGSGYNDKATEQDESAIKKATAAYAEAYNRQDAEALASLWSEDGMFINFSDHETVQGRDEIEKYFEDKFDEEGELTLKITVDSIQFENSDEGIEKGIATISYEDQPPEQIAYEAKYVKNDDTWLLQKRIAIDVEQPPSHFEHLKELDWFAGNWIDDEDSGTIVIKSAYKWDKNKNFLINSFAMNILGQKELSGQNVIGWDPVREKIRSWMFDSDGGFGEGVWVKDGDNWYVTVTYTLADGKRASAIHVYTKVDDSAYTFSSQSRDINGKVMPNIGPFKAVKTQVGG